MKAGRPEVLWCSNTRMRTGNGWRFPRAVERQILAEASGNNVLHLFGGLARFGLRMDIDAAVRPHVIADAWMPPFREASFDVVVIDPPYIRLNSQEKVALFQQAAFVARHKVIWFHTIWMSGSLGLAPVRSWLVRVGDECTVRCLQIFAVTKRVEPVQQFKRGPAIKYNRWMLGNRLLPFGDSDPAVR